MQKELAVVYITQEARHLCLYGNGTGMSSASVHETIMQMRGKPECGIPASFFEAPCADEQFVEGPGCWHPTFPARLHDILILIGMAVDRLNAKMQSGSQNGWAVVMGFDGERGFGGAPCVRCFLETADL